MFIFGKVNAVEKELCAIKNTNKTILEQLQKYEDERDRVDISLKEYENLKEENRSLTDKNRFYSRVLMNLGISIDTIEHMVPDSLHTYECHLLEHDPLSLRKRIRIEFDVE